MCTPLKWIKWGEIVLLKYWNKHVAQQRKCCSDLWPSFPLHKQILLWVVFASFFILYFLHMFNILSLCSWPATYESLLGTKHTFPRPIPLSVSFCARWCFTNFITYIYLFSSNGLLSLPRYTFCQGFKASGNFFSKKLHVKPAACLPANRKFNWQEMVDFLVDVWEHEGLYDWVIVLRKLVEFSIYQDSFHIFVCSMRIL